MNNEDNGNDVVKKISNEKSNVTGMDADNVGLDESAAVSKEDTEGTVGKYKWLYIQILALNE